MSAVDVGFMREVMLEFHPMMTKAMDTAGPTHSQAAPIAGRPVGRGAIGAAHLTGIGPVYNMPGGFVPGSGKALSSTLVHSVV